MHFDVMQNMENRLYLVSCTVIEQYTMRSLLLSQSLTRGQGATVVRVWQVVQIRHGVTIESL